MHCKNHRIVSHEELGVPFYIACVHMLFINRILARSMPKKGKYYAVAAGRKTGIFTTWDDCRRSVTGFSGQSYCSFKSKAEAEQYLSQRGISTAGSNGALFDSKKTSASIQETILESIRNEKKSAPHQGKKRSFEEKYPSGDKEWATPVKRLKKQKRDADGAAPSSSHGTAATSVDEVKQLLGLLEHEMSAEIAKARDQVEEIVKAEGRDAVFEAWSDGGSNPNPGPGGSGFVVRTPSKGDGPSEQTGRLVVKGGLYLGESCTNNIAEYVGLMCSLSMARSLGIKRVRCRIDSQLIEKQVKKVYRVKNEVLRPFYQECSTIITEGFGGARHANLHWVERKYNSEADSLATLAMEEQKCFFKFVENN